MLKRYLFIISLICCSAIFAETAQTPKFSPFTGKVLGNKVRLRTGSDLDSYIIKQLNKGDLLLIVGDTDDFYAAQPQENIKAYIFRSYIIDNVVEADRVNIRLAPNTESSIIGKLKKGDKIEGDICDSNHKWMEIQIPRNVKFYVSKEYVENVGNPSYLAKMLLRKKEVGKLLTDAFFITTSECKKPFNEMSPQSAIDKFDTIIKNYSDFKEHSKQAKEGLSLLQDNYLQKKIAYLEAKANLSDTEKKELSKAEKEVKQFSIEAIKIAKLEKEKWAKKNTTFMETANISSKMKKWCDTEESIYLSWSTYHPEKNIHDFYQEQVVNASTITGFVRPYDDKINGKPGEYLLIEDNIPVAYIYSTKIDLEKLIGQDVSLKVSPRPNNDFAFPAYFVNSVE
jgi:uncharacterized protein YgiM (DUF1202 family)